MTLEDRIRQLAAKGELTHLSVIPIAHRGGIGWSATYAAASHFGRMSAVKPDPVDAMIDALNAKPSRMPPDLVRGKSEPKPRKKPQAAPAADANPWD